MFPILTNRATRTNRATVARFVRNEITSPSGALAAAKIAPPFYRLYPQSSTKYGSR